MTLNALRMADEVPVYGPECDNCFGPFSDITKCQLISIRFTRRLEVTRCTMTPQQLGDHSNNLMGRHVLFAYVDGSDLDEVAHSIETEFSGFIRESRWKFAAPYVVNQQYPKGPTHSAEDLPDWDLGLNVSVPDPGIELVDWMDDILQIAHFLERLQESTHRDFVIGICDLTSGVAEDLFYVESPSPDLSMLVSIIGCIHHR